MTDKEILPENDLSKDFSNTSIVTSIEPVETPEDPFTQNGKVEKLYFITDKLVDIFYFCKGAFFSSKKEHKLESHGFPGVRSKILNALQFLECGCSTNIRLPWLNQNYGYSELLRIRRDYIRSKWISYYSHKPAFDIDHVKLNRWDILTLYPDFPLPSLFDFDRFMKSFPKEIQEEHYPYKKDQLNLKFEGEKDPGLWDILRAATELQSEWAARLFVQPVAPGADDDGFYDSLYNFSGQLLSGLMVISELVDSVNSGLIFHANCSPKLTEYLNAFLDELPQSNATFADLLFLHGAIWKLWLNINGMTDDAMAKSIINTVVSPVILSYRRKAPIIDQFKIFLRKNPVSNLLMIDFLADTRLLNPEEKEEFPKIGWLFQTNIGEEVLFWLANYTYSGLMSSYPSVRSTCFGTDVPDAPQELFQYRVACVGQLLNSINEEIKENPKAKNRFLGFCIYFYEILLREWLLETPVKDLPLYPLPQIDKPAPPLQVKLSHISVSKSRSGHADKIRNSLKKGEPFSKLAREYSEDYVIRCSGGERGWIGRYELPYDQEPAVFLFPNDNTPFCLEIEDAYHFFLIHERKFSETTLFFERILEWTQTEEEDDDDSLGKACCSLLSPLDILLTSPVKRSADKSDLDRLRTLYQKARFYHGLLSFSNETVTALL